MTTTNPLSQPPRTEPVAPTASRQSRVGWFSLLVAAASATIASFVIAMIAAGSVEVFFLAMAVPIVVGLLVVWRWRRTGIVVLGVVLLAELLASAPFLVDALTHPETPGDFLPLALFTVATLAGSIATVPAFRHGRQPVRPSRSATVVAGAGVLIMVAATAVSLVTAGRVDSVPAQPGDIELTTTEFQFDTRSITADGGTVAVTVTNDDPTRHTFTIDELDVDLNVPPGTTQRVTFTADAGTYRYYCVPHADIMVGELIVR